MTLNRSKKLTKNVEVSAREFDNNILNGMMSLKSLKSWSGTMTSLMKILSIKKIEVPKTASQMGVLVRRLVNRLRARGVSVKFTKTNGGVRKVNLVF